LKIPPPESSDPFRMTDAESLSVSKPPLMIPPPSDVAVLPLTTEEPFSVTSAAFPKTSTPPPVRAVLRRTEEESLRTIVPRELIPPPLVALLLLTVDASLRTTVPSFAL
jgi:hypothetical protein